MRGSLAAIIVLAVLGAASSVVPFIAIVELARVLLPAIDGAPVDAGRVWSIVIIAVVALVVSFGAAFLSGVVGHFADAELQHSLRRRIVRHLQRLPLGWFDQRSSGSARKLVENDVVALHQLVAHSIQDGLTAITVPVISLVYLFVVEWRMALAALVPLVLIFLLYPLMMRGAGEKYVQYDEATQALSGATVEFVHGHRGRQEVRTGGAQPPPLSGRDEGLLEVRRRVDPRDGCGVHDRRTHRLADRRAHLAAHRRGLAHRVRRGIRA